MTNINNIKQNKEELEDLTDDVSKNRMGIVENTADIRSTCRKVKHKNWRCIKLSCQGFLSRPKVRMLLSDSGPTTPVVINNARNTTRTDGGLPVSALAFDTPRKSDVEAAIQRLEDKLNAITMQTQETFPCPGER